MNGVLVGDYLEEAIQGANLADVINDLALVVIGVVVLTIVLGMVKRVINRLFKERLTRNRLRIVLNIVGYVGLILFMRIIIKDEIRIVAVLFALAIAAIVAMIFRLKEFVASIAGSLSIVFSRTYEAGDRILLGGVKGDVIKVGLTKTTIMEIGDWVDGDLYNGKIVRIPNSLIFNEPVHNYSSEFPFLWDEIKVPVRYGSDYKEAKKMFKRVADEVVREYTESAEEYWARMVKKFLIDDTSIEPSVTMVSNDNWIEFTVRYIADYRKRRFIKDAIFTGIMDSIGESPHKIELASMTVELVAMPKLDVNIKRPE